MAPQSANDRREAPTVTVTIVPLPGAEGALRGRQIALVVGLLRRAYERRRPASGGRLPRS